MSIASEITRISGNIADAYTALDGKGATLPETQNSANLADTIDTITTGGGGNAVFAEVDNIIDSVSNSATYKDLYESGWWACESDYNGNDMRNKTTTIYNSDYPLMEGYVFADNITQVYIYTPLVLKVPENTTITYNNNTKSAKIVFSENATSRYVVFNSQKFPSAVFSSNSIRYAQGTSSSNTYYQTWGIRYFNIKLLSGNYTATSPSGTDILYANTVFRSEVLEDYKISDNLKITLSSTMNSALEILCFPKSNHVSIKKFYENYTNRPQIYGTALSATQSEKLLDSVYRDELSALREFPFILDFTEWSSSSIYLFCSASTASNQGIRRIEDASSFKIKIPDKNVYFCTSINGKNEKNQKIFTPESLKYMADNAPTVSSKTLALGAVNIAIANDYDSTIITTLTSKGWTVS